jgi:hypothetical protein
MKIRGNEVTLSFIGGAVLFSAIAASSNKRMQSDQNARYAFILTADAKR